MEIRNLIKNIYYFIKLSLKYIFVKIFVAKPKDFKTDIPIIINNYNQLDYLLQLLESLEKRGYSNIIILDNSSTYPPLLNYYKSTQYQIIYLNNNYGYLALWESGLYRKFQSKYFVYTDPDLVICENCPDNFIEQFYTIMQKYPLTSKVGFSLKIDDIPSYFRNREEVVNWEKQFWEIEKEPGLFEAPIDTTFALYRPYTKRGANTAENHIRCGVPFVMKHLPWYVDADNLSDNMKYYLRSCNRSTHWSEKNK